ncbi:MAG: hypothetical protein IT279_12110 [Ignavibacteriaceae bacterium]|nr:hypothetical protein [Ignavibacteriaceae bacterium]
MANYTQFTKGSEWRRWDLHFHTPSSHDYKNNSVTEQDLIDGLIRNEIHAVAITDHHTIDVNRIKKLQDLAKDQVLILPGIELRSELGGSELMHFIGIFPENSNIEYIWDNLRSYCKLYEVDISERGGIQRVFCDFKDTSRFIHEYGGIVSVHAGRRSNSLERLKNDIKDDLELNKCIDILEVKRASEISDYQNIVFPNIKRKLPIISCSDNHDIREYLVEEKLWIKSDLTFEGLKQIIYEPEERVRIQPENPIFDFEKSYFSEIAILESMNVIEGQELKFETNNIKLNPNLVTIIGGRGSGKSILVNYFANGFRKFDASSEKIAFKKTNSFKVKWRNSLLEDEEIFQFDKQYDLQFLFISQSEVKEKVKSPRDLGEEIKAILELDDLKFSREIEDDLQKRLSSYNQIDSWFKIKDEYGNLINDKEYIQSEIRKNSEFLKRITTKENKAKLEKYSDNIVTIQKLSEDHNGYLALYNDLMEFQKVTNERIKTLNNTIPEINFEIQLDAINQNLDRIKNELNSAQLENTEIKKEFKDYKGDLANLLSSVEKFKSTMASLEKRLKEISENEQKRIYEFNRKKEISDLIRVELERQESLINSQWEKLLQGKAGWNDRQKELMKRIINDRNIEIKGKIIFNHEHFYELISEYVDGRKIKNKNRNYELKERIGIKDFSSFIECLRDIDSLKSRFEIILLNEFSSIEKILYNLSIRSEYLYVQPEITYNGKNLTNISVGQRGTIYLCLKLATNIFSQTIIFDQPEDDLDNEFIFNDLIKIFKEIKLYRQVIIVTHNANIVVNADAEQVIVAKNTNENLSYFSGSLENPIINKEVCKILEGGEDAFNRRSNKYIGI